MALDSATVRFLKQLAEGDGKPLHECTPDEARAFGSKLAELAGPAPAMQRVEERTIAGTDGQARLRILVPIQNPLGVLVFYHGGGWVLGSIDEYDTVARKLAERTPGISNHIELGAVLRDCYSQWACVFTCNA